MKPDQKSECPAATGHSAKQNHSLNTANFATDLAPGKEVSTQIEKLALAGHVVHKDVDGAFLVCKYGLSKYCENFAELRAFALKLGVNHGA